MPAEFKAFFPSMLATAFESRAELATLPAGIDADPDDVG
jgi:hypothetical protein